MALKYTLCTTTFQENYDSDHCLLFAKVRERLSANKRASQKFDVEGSDIKKLNEVEVEELNDVEM